MTEFVNHTTEGTFVLRTASKVDAGRMIRVGRKPDRIGQTAAGIASSIHIRCYDDVSLALGNLV